MSVFKDQLMLALHEAVRNYNTSGDPNEAVVKSAVAHDFNSDQTARLLETFNTARTIYHYKTSSDRSATFKLADPTIVIPALYASQESTGAKVSSELATYADYDIPEANYVDGMVIKAAGVQDIEVSNPREYADTDLEAQADQAYRIINVTRDLAKTARDEANAAATAASILLSKVATALRSGYEDIVIPRYAALQAGYSTHDKYSPVISKLADCMPTWIVKGAADQSVDSVIDDRDPVFTAIITELDKVAEHMQVEAEMLAISSQLEKEADAFEAEWLSLVLPVMTAPEKVASVADLLNVDLLSKAAQTTISSNRETTDLFGNPITIAQKKELTPVVGDAIGGGVRKGLEGVVSDLVGAIGPGLTAERARENKQLSERLKNTQRQIMLEDLMSTDPVLSNEDPDTIARVYTAVLQMAPDVASNKEVMRAVLRQAVHSVAISPYEAQSWTDLEKNIRQLTGNVPAPQPVSKTPKGGGK